jgi:AcrR family transcriptional regulator
MATTPVSGGRATSQELDRYLDAAMAAFLRHGVSRTRVPDIAHEAGVSRTSVYRVLGPVDRAALALLDREVARLLAHVAGAVGSARRWDDVLEECALAMEAVENHPLLRKVRDDEPGIVGMALVKHTPLIIDVVSSVLEPALADLVARGVTSGREHRLVAETLVRLGITCTLAPPDRGVRELLHDLLSQRPVHRR